MRKVFIVDYREKGISKHKCIEFGIVGSAADAALVTACHAYVGMNNELDCVSEVFTDMSVHELSKIATEPEVAFLTRRALYANASELKRCAEILKGV